MYDLNINFTPKDIYNKEFKNETVGYRPQEVDKFLDSIIEDYTEFIRFIKKQERDNEDLLDEINRLKAENRKLRMNIEERTSDTGKFTSNNIDVLKRLSNLEKVVYGKEE